MKASNRGIYIIGNCTWKSKVGTGSHELHGSRHRKRTATCQAQASFRKLLQTTLPLDAREIPLVALTWGLKSRFELGSFLAGLFSCTIHPGPFRSSSVSVFADVLPPFFHRLPFFCPTLAAISHSKSTSGLAPRHHSANCQGGRAGNPK